LEANTCNWALQWQIPSKFLPPDTRYQLSARVRAATVTGRKIIWDTGVYDNNNKKLLMKNSAKTDALSTKEYRWITLGAAFVPSDNCYFWGSAVGDSDIYVEKLEMKKVQ